MSKRTMVILKAVVHLLCLLPAALLLRMYFDGGLALEADPVNYITHFTGDWALWMLLGSLAITPLRRLVAGLSWAIKFRRMIGLYAFFYATLHLLTYVLLFSGYDVAAAIAGLRAGHLLQPWTQLQMIWPTMLDDLKKRKFIQVGLAAWVILLLLAVTSPQRVLRWMGGKNWQKVHRLVYLAAALGCVHFWWLVKTGVRTPWKVTAVLTVLLVMRVGYWGMKKVGGSKAAASF